MLFPKIENPDINESLAQTLGPLFFIGQSKAHTHHHNRVEDEYRSDRHKKVEVFEVVLPDAFRDPRTVMIMPFNAQLAIHTVPGAPLHIDITVLAVSDVHAAAVLVGCGGIGQLLADRRLRDYSGVG